MTNIFRPTRSAPKVLILAAFTLSACENLPEQFKPKAAAADSEPTGTLSLEERDVEAPDVFDVTDKAIWDGRPSFGGVWVAYPGSDQPERVTIRNEDNGKTVVGALFKREAQNPGPPITVSSDAAAALGIVPGLPVTLSVRALRREPVEVPSPTPAPAPVEEVSETVLAPVAAEDSSADDLAKEIGDTLDQTAAPKPSPVAPALKAEPAQPKPQPTPAAPAASADQPGKPYLQVGTFSTDKNATILVGRLAAQNIKSIVRSNKLENGKTLFRVLAGPAKSTEELRSMSSKIADLGISDAFPVAK